MEGRPGRHLLLCVVLLAAACSTPDQPTPARRADPSPNRTASGASAASDVGTDDDSMAKAPPVADAAIVAARFAEAWVRQTDDPNSWWTGVQPWCDDGLAASLRGADPEAVPASRLIGAPRPSSGTPQTGLHFEVPTDTGSLSLTVAAIDGRWLVSDIDFVRADR
jgi:hypothetical protein